MNNLLPAEQIQDWNQPIPVLDTLGIIAGSRTLPFICAEEARSKGAKRIVAVAFEGETDPELAKLVDDIVWLRVGQLGKMIDAFTSREVHHCIMAGQIAPKNLFDFRPDMRTMGVLLRLKEKNAHTIFGAIGDELAKDGVQLISAVPWLKAHMPPNGFRMGSKLTNSEEEDVRYALKTAKAVATLEIGQTVVVRDQTVLAVEAFEGTDACLTRGGELAKKKDAVAGKVARKKHDLRFDLPCFGLRTIQTCADHGIRVLAVEACRSVLLDSGEAARLCQKTGVTVLAANVEE